MLERSRYVVVKGPSTGLGDLVRAVAMGILYARKSGRLLWIDWSDGLYGDVAGNVFRETFVTSGKLFAAEPPPANGSVFPAAWEGFLDRSLSGIVEETGWKWDRNEAITRYSADPTRLDYEQDVVVLWAHDQLPGLTRSALPLTSRWHPFIERAVFRQFFKPCVTPIPEISRTADEFIQRCFRRPMIGVHIRHSGDARAVQRVPTEVYEEHIQGLRAQSPGAGVFLATDHAGVENRWRECFGEVVTLPKWLPGDGESLLHTAPVAERARNLKAALVDILLLAECDYLLYPVESSFSTVAACLSGSPLANIYPLLPDSRFQPPSRQRLKWFKTGLFKLSTTLGIRR